MLGLDMGGGVTSSSTGPGELPLELGSDGEFRSSASPAVRSMSISDGIELERRPGFSESRRFTQTSGVRSFLPRLSILGRAVRCAIHSPVSKQSIQTKFSFWLTKTLCKELVEAVLNFVPSGFELVPSFVSIASLAIVVSVQN